MKKICSIFVLTSFLSFNTVCLGATVVGSLTNNSNAKSSVLTGIASANEKYSKKQKTNEAKKETSSSEEVYSPPTKEAIATEMNSSDNSTPYLSNREEEINNQSNAPSNTTTTNNVENNPNNVANSGEKKKEKIFISSLSTKDEKTATLSVFDSFLNFFNLGNFREMNPVNVKRFSFVDNRENTDNMENATDKQIQEETTANEENSSLYSKVCKWYADNPTLATTITVVSGVVIIGGLCFVTGITAGQAGILTGPAAVAVINRIGPALMRSSSNVINTVTSSSRINTIGELATKTKLDQIALEDQAVLSRAGAFIKGGVVGGAGGLGVSGANIIQGMHPNSNDVLEDIKGDAISGVKNMQKNIINPNADTDFSKKMQEALSNKEVKGKASQETLARDILNNPKASPELKEMASKYMKKK